MIFIQNKLITKVEKESKDGICLNDGLQYIIKNCIIDLSKLNVNSIDEALGITKGSSGEVNNCIIRGAAKLVLCGCGDADKVHLETGKVVTFNNCILEDFGRRGPEVQDGMKIILNDCLIRNWGTVDRFDVRSFGAWAHHEGKIIANNCVFQQTKLKYTLSEFKYFILDKINHIGQAYNDEGLKGLFKRKTWKSGLLWGLVATSNGYVEANNCWKSNNNILLENSKNELSDEEGMTLLIKLIKIRSEIKKAVID